MFCPLRLSDQTYGRLAIFIPPHFLRANRIETSTLCQRLRRLDRLSLCFQGMNSSCKMKTIKKVLAIFIYWLQLREIFLCSLYFFSSLYWGFQQVCSLQLVLTLQGRLCPHTGETCHMAWVISTQRECRGSYVAREPSSCIF